MKYTSIQGTGVVAHRTELTVEEKYAVIEAVRVAKVVGEFKPDFVRPLLQAVCDTCISIVAPVHEMGLDGAVHGIEEVIAAARKDDSQPVEKDISTNCTGLKITPELVLEAGRMLDIARRLHTMRQENLRPDADPTDTDEFELFDFMDKLVARIKEA